jgi:hypothetical protein
MNFLGKNLIGKEPARCVDGRPDPKSPQGPQMLGGSLHPLTVSAIISNSNFDPKIVTEGINKLQNAGFAVGVHWGAHRHDYKSDCGFADRLKDILQTAKDHKKEIVKRLVDVYNTNKIDASSLSGAYKHILNYDINKIKITGKDLIDLAIKNQAPFETLVGDHGEQAAFVNIQNNTTLNTQGLNGENKQAFNLDLWSAIAQTKVLNGSNADLIRDLSLILYMATEMVLVEQKDKPALPVIINH